MCLRATVTPAAWATIALLVEIFRFHGAFA
jgi:hypothetical protein